MGLFLLAWRSFGEDPLALAILWFYAAFLLAVLVIDLEQRRVLNVMLLPGAILALGFSLLPGTPSLGHALLGGLIGFGFFLLIALVGRGAMGAGDVKLAGLIGMMTGFPNVISALVIGIVFGGIAALALLISRRATRKSTMAYAPYLALGALLTLWSMLGS
jgi:leader peptidase (prepilin peptidase)/N-methyltransferase